MSTDIERLHKVVDGKEQGRGCGKTFARCHEVAGLVELGHKYIFCITTNHKDWQYIEPMLSDVLQEYGIKLTRVRKPDEYRANESIIRLIPKRDQEQRTRGQEGVLVPMGHWD